MSLVAVRWDAMVKITFDWFDQAQCIGLMNNL